MTERGLIDVNVQLGPVAGGARGAPLETVVRERDSHGVRIALVRHRTALLGEATIGNEALLEEIAGDPAFAPVGVLSVDWAEVVDTAAPLAGRVAAFWLEGKAAPGSSLSAEPIVRAAARTGRPLMVPISGWGSAAAIGAATEGLGVPVVLTGSHYTTSVDDVAAGRRSSICTSIPAPWPTSGRSRRSSPSSVRNGCCSAPDRRSGPSSHRSTRS